MLSARHLLHGEFACVADIEEQRAVHAVPVGQRQVATQDVGRNHPGEVHGILRASERGRVAELGLFQVVDRAAHLDRHREGIDPLGDAVLAEHLRTEQASVGFSEENLDCEHLGARIISRVRVRVEVDLLEIHAPKLLEDLLARPGLGDRGLEDLTDRGALSATETGVATGDHVGRDPALSVSRPGERDQRPLAGHEIPDLDRVADREDLGVRRAHVLINADPATLADLDPGHLRQSGLWTHPDCEDHDIRRMRLA